MIGNNIMKQLSKIGMKNSLEMQVYNWETKLNQSIYEKLLVSDEKCKFYTNIDQVDSFNVLHNMIAPLIRWRFYAKDQDTRRFKTTPKMFGHDTRLEAKDEFFLSSRHEEKTEAYTLLNSRLTYSRDDWEVALWGKNLNDEETIVRGFGSFGNDPRKFYVTEPYYQFGAPRTVGVSASMSFR